jgi:transcriptional regulator with XRE-family HTH domain
MNLINDLYSYVKGRYPDATVELAPPLRPDGIWSLDVDLSDRHFTVEWSASMGFGFSSVGDANFGEAADEVFQSLDQAQGRVDQLMAGERTAPPLPILLSRLREHLGLTQQELAERLGVRQATISGLERRQDIQLSTLRRVVEALGGTVEVMGVFPGARYRISTRSSAGGDCAGITPRLESVRVRANIDREVCSGPEEPTALDEAHRGQDLRFTSLERHNELERSVQIAQLIRRRGSIFAECA